jgi:hypothetical protein
LAEVWAVGRSETMKFPKAIMQEQQVIASLPAEREGERDQLAGCVIAQKVDLALLKRGMHRKRARSAYSAMVEWRYRKPVRRLWWRRWVKQSKLEDGIKHDWLCSIRSCRTPGCAATCASIPV